MWLVIDYEDDEEHFFNTRDDVETWLADQDSDYVDEEDLVVYELPGLLSQKKFSVSKTTSLVLDD